MSIVNISGTLLLNGNLTCTDDVTIATDATVISIPDPATMKTYPSGNTITTANGTGRIITSSFGNIIVDGYVTGYGFPSDRGPGCNSTKRDSSGNLLTGFGATHGGLGYIANADAPGPQSIYGNWETPMSLGSGAGYYHDMSTTVIDGTTYPVASFGEDTSGGGAIKFVARSGYVNIDGTVNMDGATGPHLGGGAGGSIWIHAWGIDGTGYLTAQGGGAAYPAGGGGGGYISLWHEQYDRFNGAQSVEGHNGGGKGRFCRKLFEADLTEPFTGTVFNQKWWGSDSSYVQNNGLLITNTSDTPSIVGSKYQLTGRDFEIACDYSSVGTEPDHYAASLRLYMDSLNWIAVSRHNGEVWAETYENGSLSRYSRPCTDTTSTFRISKMDSTFAVQFWNSASLTPSTVLFDCLTGLAEGVFQVQLGLSQITSTESFLTDYLRLNNANITNRRVPMEGIPTTGPAFNVIGGTSQFVDRDFYVSRNSVQWDSTGLTLDDGEVFSEHHAITSEELGAKRFTLRHPPDNPLNVAVNIVHGGQQIPGVDFAVTYDEFHWAGFGLDGVLMVGDVLRIIYNYSPDAFVVPLRDLLAAGDQIRLVYALDTTTATPIQAGFHSVRIYEGAVYNATTTEPVLYVDANYGSDSSSGLALEPLKTLSISTTWAKPGSTVVLYDGTYAPTDVSRKNITIRGAEGSRVRITSSIAQDTTGSGWESNALSFDRCMGLVDNVSIADGTTGIRLINSPDFEINRCDMSNLTTGISMVNSDPTVFRSKINGVDKGIIFENCVTGRVESTLIYEATTGIFVQDSTNVVVSGNTLDQCVVGVDVSGNSTVYVASSNITNSNGAGIALMGDSSGWSYHNNFFGTVFPYAGTPIDTSGDISVDPKYFLPGSGDYHLDATSPDIGAGIGTFNQFWKDLDGIRRVSVDIGACQYTKHRLNDQSHVGDWFVSSTGNDWLNNGDATHPFLTLDRAFAETLDATIHIDGGHYDTYYLALSNKAVDLNELTIFTSGINHFVTYRTLSSQDISDGMFSLPGFAATPADASNIALNVVGGPSQVLGLDYGIEYGNLVWKGYALEPFLAAGDILRIVYLGRLQRKALNTLALHNHYSNLNLGRTLYVSPSGSDSTVLGGDGTNSGGLGTRNLPYRTIQRALQDSSYGSNIVVMAGEYPLFDGTAGRVIVPMNDRTAVGAGTFAVEDFFDPNDFRAFGSVLYDEVPWDMTAAGSSWVRSNGGWLSMSYDGVNQPYAVSTFSMTGEWTVTASLRNAIDSMWMSVSGPDDTVGVRLDGTRYEGHAHTGGRDFTCWGSTGFSDFVSQQVETVTDNTSHDIITDTVPESKFIVEYIQLTAVDITNKWVPLGFLPDDCTSVAVNIIGGVAQELGVDFTLEDARISWAGMTLDGDLEPGDLLRIIYMDSGVYGPLQVRLSYQGGIMYAEVNNGSGWTPAMRRNVMEAGPDAWKVSFHMSGHEGSHGCTNGRGFASNFLAVAKNMTGAGVIEPYQYRTERRTVVLYKDSYYASLS